MVCIEWLLYSSYIVHDITDDVIDDVTTDDDQNLWIVVKLLNIMILLLID